MSLACFELETFHMPVTSQNAVHACRLFSATFGTPRNVYYPGCGNDTSPTIAFPESTIIFLDPLHDGLKEIKKEFPNAVTVCARAEDVPLGAKYDLVLDIHSHAPFEAEIRDLKVGGHLLIANKMSDRAFEHQKLMLVAVTPWKSEYAEDGLAGMEVVNLERYKEIEPNPPRFSFSNKRKIKAPFYVFRKIG